jgi:hypothetical protein
MRIRTVALSAAVMAVTAGAITFAQNRNPNPKFHAELNRLWEVAVKNRAAKKVTGEWDGEEPFRDSKVKIQKVAPGGSVAVTVPGDYPAGTVVLSERDLVTLSAVTVSPKSYSAQMTVAANAFPGFSRLFAMTPLGSSSDSYFPVAFIEAVYRLDLKSPDGIVVKITPLEKLFTIDAQQMNARVKYQAEYYKPNETKPFETLLGEQSFNSGNEDPAHFDISFGSSASSPQVEIEKLSAKLADPKATDADKAAAMERIMKLQQQMMQELTTNAAGMDKKVADFGCGDVTLFPTGVPGGVEGQIRCGENYHGGYLKVAGTITIVK